jgi:hypothetical protein
MLGTIISGMLKSTKQSCDELDTIMPLLRNRFGVTYSVNIHFQQSKMCQLLRSAIPAHFIKP